MNDIHPGKCTKNVQSERTVFDLGNNAKMDLLSEDLEDCADEKVIIWAWFRNDIENIKRLLIERKIKFITADDENCAQKFESDNSIRVFLGQTYKGIGITLNSATCTIYYSHGLALEPRLQSMDRNYRIGQEHPVVVKDYIATGTIEENVVALLQHKNDVKEFMQSKIMDCMFCKQCTSCNASYLQEGCMYADDVRKAASKKTLWLVTV